MKLTNTYIDNNKVSQSNHPCQAVKHLYNKNEGDISPQKIRKEEIKMSLGILCIAINLATILLLLIDHKTNWIPPKIVSKNEIIIILSWLLIFSIVFTISQVKIIIKDFKSSVNKYKNTNITKPL